MTQEALVKHGSVPGQCIDQFIIRRNVSVSCAISADYHIQNSAPLSL